MIPAVVLLLLVVVLVNWGIDVKGLYSGDEKASHVAAYVEKLEKSSYGLVLHPFDRDVKLELARQSGADCFVTGASRENQISLDTFPPAREYCDRLVNLTVQGGTYEDMITFVGAALYHENISALYLGIGPWMLRWRADMRWTEIEDAYQAARGRLGLKTVKKDTGWSEKLLNLINGEYFARNVEVLLDQGLRRVGTVAKVVAPDGNNLSDDEAVLLPDGSLLYSRRYLSAVPPPRDAVGTGSYKIGEPYVDPSLAEELANLIRNLLEREIYIAIILVPYHPIVFECRADYVCDALWEVESFLRGMAGDLGAEVIGSYQPEAFGLDWRQFYDDVHLSREGLGQLH